MTYLLTDSLMPKLRIALILAFTAGIAYYLVSSIRWPLMCDSPVMHYVNFLMDHGRQPYQTITDNNMPGAYLSERWAMDIFGAGDLGWRLYEYFLLALITACMVQIAARVDWLAGLFGGCFFALQHGTEGPVAANEREQLMTALFLVGYVFLFLAVRKQRPVVMLGFGIVSGAAASIKPSGLLLTVSVTALALLVLRRRKIRVWWYLINVVIGFATVVAVCVGFLLKHQAVGAFWFVLHTITPAYVALAHPSFPDMLRALLPKDLRWFVLIVGIPASLFRLRWDWERLALALGALDGLVTFFLQRKGFNHHRYTFEALLLFLIGTALVHDLTIQGWPRRFGVLGFVLTIVYFIPSYAAKIHEVADNSDLTITLEADLSRFGVNQLQGNVMCFDMVYGCIDALYHLKVLESTGFTGDLLLFFPQQTVASNYYRNLYWESVRIHPADVLIMTNEYLQLQNTFNKVQTWPDFGRYLQSEYTLVVDREFPWEAVPRSYSSRKAQDPPYRAYRIYVRNGTPLLPVALHLLQPAAGTSLLTH